MDEQKSENNLEGSSFLGFDSRFLGKCHQKAVKSRILNYVYFCRFQTLSMPTKPSHSKCLRLSFWKPGGHSKLQICHIDPTRRKMFIPLGLHSPRSETHCVPGAEVSAMMRSFWPGQSGQSSKSSGGRVPGSLTATSLDSWDWDRGPD